MDLLLNAIGFEWDDGNKAKNWEKHRVAWYECEDLFFNEPLLVLPDEKHSNTEARFLALGRTGTGRLLFNSFTVRREEIRIISAREMNRRERIVYHEAAEKDSNV